MDKSFLISLSVKYAGEYEKIIEAIRRKETVKETEGIDALTILDEEYPKCFLRLRYPPLVLFYKGDLGLLKEEKIAVVGSRHPDAYALKATERLVKHHHDKVIVSGLAKGIDAMAHKNAAKTIGILGCGIDYYYPAVNRELIDEVVRKGLVLSEYPGLVKPLGFHFPFRNRLICALSEVLYVMNCKERSGTSTSITQALELGKDVKVLPYGVFETEGIYNNHLIKEGADMIEIEELTTRN